MDALSKAAGRYISKLSNKIRRKIDAFASKSAFSGAQGRVLHFVLAQSEDLFQKDIEEEFGLRPPTATELLKKMEQSGLIRREATAYDARLKKIILTEKAMAYKDEVVKNLTGLEAQLTQDIDPEELAVFYRVMEKMLRNLP